jgi:predicted ATP-dependent endonuclease of OLD family
MNILVGENEAGKSTVLEAINVVLNQMYRNADKSILAELLNIDNQKKFIQNPSISTLPNIYIEIQFNMENSIKNSEYFYGENNKEQEEEFGIVFECKYNEDIDNSLESSIEEGIIPYEYYEMTWKTFAGLPYMILKKPFINININTFTYDNRYSFNSYNKTLFNNNYDGIVKLKAKNTFRTQLEKMFQKIGLESINENEKFGIDNKKVILENILSVYDHDIRLENKGSGMESLIKVQMALIREQNDSNVILMEEPENHLCYTNMNMMLREIESRQDTTQMIITTHSDMIASRLNLKNIIWLGQGEKATLLNDIDENIAEFFVKADHNGFLQLLLADKAFLVEGATEFLLLPQIYKQITGHSFEEDKIGIISCNGVSYLNYLEIVKKTNKKIAVITDNDRETAKVKKMELYNQAHPQQHIFMDEKTENWTWEVCFYHLNKPYFNQNIKTNKKYEYRFHGEIQEDDTLGKMLNNKVKIAYIMLNDKNELQIPKYVKDAIAWIKE